MDSEEKDNEISRDLNRTYPTHVFYQQSEGIGQQSLYHVLKTYSVYDKKVNPSSTLRQNLPCNTSNQSIFDIRGREPAVAHWTVIRLPSSLKARVQMPGNQNLNALSSLLKMANILLIVVTHNHCRQRYTADFSL